MIGVIGLVVAIGFAKHVLVLAIPGAFVLWVAWVKVNPMTNCGWCKGKGRHPLSGRKYRGRCWNPRCKGGTVQRLGSKMVARAWLGLRAYRAKQEKD